ncbi:Uu.00g051120.m01.CDS01 [Anthostomella pinea]|uniref:Uu.00g051120.m01.CDS01 n=1 Tax=Anthostomella pinea TaxID=933095 RepID=A0AAI8VTM1_9PEZI|nr:Uu.00g051120.m01.CDS01 [Anthostomella pinea]
MAVLEGETYRLAFPTFPDLENAAYVSYGVPFDIACTHHIKETYNAQRAYIIASALLSKNTDEVKKLENGLGDRHAGTWPGIAPHTPWAEVIEATKDALSKKADCLVIIGGGSLVDGAKAMLLFMVNNVTSVDGIREFEKKCSARDATGKKSSEIPVTSPTAALICIPTSLSGGEYTWYAGGTYPDDHLKSIMVHPFCGPRLIINDPKLSITAPEWRRTAGLMRDEDMDQAAIEGFNLIVPNLLITRKDWTDEEARLNCMIGVNKVMIMLKKVGHDETSCILLPSVMKWNAKVNGEKQERLKNVMWSEAPVAEVLKRRGLKPDSSDACDALDVIFRGLRMPRSLQDKGVGRDKFQAWAVNSLKDPCCKANPIPIEREEQVLEILEITPQEAAEDLQDFEYEDAALDIVIVFQLFSAHSKPGSKSPAVMPCLAAYR